MGGSRESVRGVTWARGIAGTVGVVVAIGMCLAAPANGAITIGSDLTKAPTLGLLCSPTCTLYSPAIPGRDTASPIDGVVVRWRIRAGSTAGPVQLRVTRPAAGGQSTGLSTSQVENPPVNAVSTFATRLPIKAGDFAGIDIDNAGPNYFNDTTPAATRSAFQPKLAANETRAPTSANQPSREVLVNADIELDADGDEYGDETQDLCSTDATTQGPCPPKTLTVTKAGTGTGVVTSSPAGIDCGTDCAEDFPDSSVVTLTATSSAGSAFGGFDGGGCSTNPCEVTMNQARTVNAVFNDTNPPQTKITKKPRSKSDSESVKYKFKSDEAGSSFVCKVDKKRYKPCSSPRKIKVNEGKHKFSVRATDRAGNLDKSPATDKFKIVD